MARLTVAEFQARIDPAYLAPLTSGDESGGAVNVTRLGAALDDAYGELQGYIDRLSAARRPGEATVNVHAAKVALYLLTLNRPGKEFEQIRNAYTDTIRFYEELIDEARTVDLGLGDGEDGGSAGPLGACSPPAVFTRETLKGFGDG